MSLSLDLDSLGDLEGAREAWEPLAERSGNIFSTWEWASTWWNAFGRDRPLMLNAVVDEAGETVAILPLYVSSRRPARTVRFIGHGPADQLGPVCDAALLDVVMQALRSELSERSFPWGIFIADRLPGAHDWTDVLGGRVLLTEPSPVLPIEGASWDEFLAGRSRNFREQVRRRERKLCREHDVHYRLADRDTLEKDFETLVRLHELRWGAGSRTFDEDAKRFHRDFASVALDKGWLRLWLLEVDGSPVAAWYGFRFGRFESFYQAGRDPAWDSYRVGFVLLTHSMREAFNDGMREYRLLRGMDAYKDRFGGRDDGIETVAVARGVARAVAGLGSAAQRTMPVGVRRRLARLAGS